MNTQPQFNVSKVNCKKWKLYTLFGNYELTISDLFEHDTNNDIFCIKNYFVKFSTQILEKINNFENLNKSEYEISNYLLSFITFMNHDNNIHYELNVGKVTETIYKVYTPYQNILINMVNTKENYIYNINDTYYFKLSKPLDFFCKKENHKGVDYEIICNIVNWYNSTFRKQVTISDTFTKYTGIYSQKLLMCNDLLATLPKKFIFNEKEMEVNKPFVTINNATFGYAAFAIQYPIGSTPIIGLVFVSTKNNTLVYTTYINGIFTEMNQNQFYNGQNFKDIVSARNIPKRTNLLFEQNYFSITRDTIMILDCSNLIWKKDCIDWKGSIGNTMNLSYFNFIAGNYGKKEIKLGNFEKEFRGYTITCKNVISKQGLHTSELMRVNFKDLVVA